MKRFLFFVLFCGFLVGFGYWLRQEGYELPKFSSPTLSKPETSSQEPATTTYTPETEALLLEGDVPLLDRINAEYVKVVQKVLPSVVSVSTFQPGENEGEVMGEDWFNLPENSKKNKKNNRPQTQSHGSGVIISREGHIVTSYHVVNNAEEIEVHLSNGQKFTAKKIGLDELSDIALLKIEAKNIQALPWGDSEAMQVGQQVLAVGSPYQLGESVSSGIISAKGRNPEISESGFENFLQTDAAINPGNSGGALVNIRGELIGINTAILSGSGGFQGIGFAVPSNLARFAVESLIKNGRVVRGYLGVIIQPVTPDLKEAFALTFDQGALVTEVSPDTPAGKAGILPEDVIIEFDGVKIKDPTHLRLIVSQTPVGKTVKLILVRQSKQKEIMLKVTELPNSLAKNQNETQSNSTLKPEEESLKNVLAGITVQNLDDHHRRRFKFDHQVSGVIVTDVGEASIAAEKGLQPGDIILEMRPKDEKRAIKITDLKSFLATAKKIKKDQDVLLYVRKPKGSTFILLKAKP